MRREPKKMKREMINEFLTTNTNSYYLPPGRLHGYRSGEARS